MYDFDPDRLAKIRALEADGYPTFPTGFQVTHTSKQLLELAEGKDEAALEALGDAHCFAGRLMFKNEMGKAGFGRVLDRDGRLQIYVRKDSVGERAYALWKRLDLGDIVGVRGVLMRTRTGELSLRASEVVLLSKCINSLPDKWHGITDPEVKHRQRYVDLFVDADGQQIFRKRARIVRYIRDFLDARSFLEVETPMMQPIPGGATARPFITHHNALDMKLYLRIAPELYLKRLVVGGLERVYEINRNFRNEGVDSFHNPEFTMLEFYQAYATWEDLMALTEELIEGIAVTLTGGTTISWAGRTIELARPWRRAGMDELIAEKTGLALDQVTDPDALRARWLQDHPDADPTTLPTTMGRWFEWFFDAYVEKDLIQPTFVTRFPVEISPLARRNDQNPNVADRFEFFIGGREFGNGFNELNDPVDQAERFAAQVRARAAGDQEAMFFDADYIQALSYGLPPTAGEGIGIDRLVMLFTDAASIRDVILFPHVRARNG